MRREAVFARAGWYPAGREALSAWLRSEVGEPTPGPAVAVIAPHAGYRFSGPVAAAAYKAVAVPTLAIILTVVHRPLPRSRPLAVWPDGAWETPLGDVAVDADLTSGLLESGAGFEVDPETHLAEHSGELQVPFLRWLNPDVRIAVVAVSERDPGRLVAAGEAIARIAGGALVVATTDLSHMADTTGEDVRRRDQAFIDRILALDPEGLHRAATTPEATMCGYLPVTVALAAARALGATRADLARYGTSADVTGRHDYVVGYAGVAVRSPAGPRTPRPS